MAEMNLDGSSNGIDTSAHRTGNPIPLVIGEGVTIGHTWLILAGALAILWLLGAGVFRGVRL